jgi:transcription initiation factor TFIIB
MSKLSNELNLPRNVLETGSMVYRKALTKNMIRGRTILSVVVAALYVACRKCGVLRSLTDVAKAANIPRKTAARNYRFLYQKLELDVPRVQPTSYVTRLVSRLDLLGDTEILALRLVEVASNNNLTNGRSPAGMAASCIYVSSRILGKGLTQQQIALEAQVTEVTIRNRYKDMMSKINIEIRV